MKKMYETDLGKVNKKEKLKSKNKQKWIFLYVLKINSKLQKFLKNC